MYDLIIKNASIVDKDTTHKTNILIKDEKIAGYRKDLKNITSKQIIDVKGHLVIPGCIDSHTHIMDPGFTHRENFYTGTCAAAAGGITTIIDMPCCSLPPIRSVNQLYNKIEKIKAKAMVDYALWGGVTGEDVKNGWLHNIKELSNAGVCGFKVYMVSYMPTFPRVNDDQLLECFKAVKKTGLFLGIHAENRDICEFNINKLKKEKRTDGPAWAEARNILSEKVAIELCIKYAAETGCKTHIVHTSSGIGSILIGEAKQKGINITAEVTPQHLILNYKDSMTKYKQFAKVTPPLRTKKDNKILWQSLANGKVDFVATDHAPFEIKTEKKDDIWNSSSGIPGLETMVSLIISEGYHKKRLSLSRVVEVLSESPAKHYGLFPQKGSMLIGSDADLTVIDLKKKWVVDKDNMYTMAKYTPFHQMKLKGKPIKTIVRGQLVYDEESGIVGKKGYGQFIKSK